MGRRGAHALHGEGWPRVVKIQPIQGEVELHVPEIIEGHHHLLGQLGEEEDCPRDVPIPGEEGGRGHSIMTIGAHMHTPMYTHIQIRL